MSRTNSVVTSLRLSRAEHFQLCAHCRDTKQSISAVIRAGLRAVLPPSDAITEPDPHAGRFKSPYAPQTPPASFSDTLSQTTPLARKLHHRVEPPPLTIADALRRGIHGPRPTAQRAATADRGQGFSDKATR